jgi:long-chain acyl-CoA synthetase
MIEFSLIKPIDAHLREKAKAHGGKIAFHDSTLSVSYADLEVRTARLAAALDKLGVRPGEMVGIHLPNSVRFVEACLAVVRGGAVAVPISVESSSGELLYRLQDAGCAAVVTTPDHVRALIDLKATIPTMRHLIVAGNSTDSKASSDQVLDYDSLINVAADPPSAKGVDIDTPAFIIYTSGTSGKAKGVLLTQRSMLWVVAACWHPIFGLGPEDHMLSSLPLFHSYGLDAVVLGTLATGATTRIMERFSTDQALALLRSGHFTVFPGVPTMFHYLLERAGEERLNFGRLRVCMSGGAVLSGQLNAEFERRTGVPLVDGYGITETSTAVTFNWPGRPRVLGSCGLPLPGVAVRIVDPVTREDVPYGVAGELIVRGPNLMKGYHNKPEETAKALVGGWYLTGDLGVADRAGFLRITGRLSEIIIRGGQNIAPAEVEEVVLQCALVLDCALVGQKHPFLGEVPVLFVVPKDTKSFDVAAVKSFCERHLSAYKMPKAILQIEQIPRTGSGKIKRFELANLLA